MRVKTFYRVLRLISAVVLFFFIWTFGPVWQAVAFAATPQGQVAEAKDRTGTRNIAAQTTAERFEKALEGIRAGISKAGEKVNRGEDATAEVADVKAKRAEIEKIDVALRGEFAATEKKLKDAKLPQVILDRHTAFVKNYENNLTQLKSELDDIDQAKTASDRKAKIEQARLHLEAVKPPRKHVPLDPNKLPNRLVKGKKRMPRLRKEDFEKDFPQQKKTNKLASQRVFPIANGREWTQIASKSTRLFTSHSRPVLLAYNGVASDVPFSLGVQPSKQQPKIHNPQWNVPQLAFAESAPLLLAQAVDLPTADDLAETPEIQFTQDIQNLAAQLNNNPVQIYSWVRNNIEYAPTYGSIQGADQCLQSKICNDMDTASLLIALLRVSGIYAHYVYGTVDIPTDKAMNWVGGVTDPNVAGTVFATNGVPVTAIVSGGTITYERIEHVWVKAFIDMIPSRGAVQRQGNTWVPLDASFKQYTYVQGIDISSAVPFDAQTFANQILSTATTNTVDGSITNINSAYVQQTMQDYQTQVQNYIQQNYPNATVGDVIGKKDLIQQNYPILLGTLPYKTVQVGSEFATVPDDLRETIGFSIPDSTGATAGLTYTTSMPEIAGKKITLSFSPATANDQTVINSFLPTPNPDGSSIQPSQLPTALPAYLINLKPVLRIAGQIVATGASSIMGSEQPFTISLGEPGVGLSNIENTAKAGEYYGIGVDTGRIGDGTLKTIASKITATKTKLIDGNYYDLSEDDLIGDLLFNTMASYFSQLDATDEASAITNGVVRYRTPSIGMFSLVVNVQELFQLPISISSQGMMMDVDRIMQAVFSMDGNMDKVRQYMMISGSTSSAYENLIPDLLFSTTQTIVQGVSAVKALQIANDQGVPIYAINQSNIAAALPTLMLEDTAKTDIQNAINAGKVVIAPKMNISYYGWTGCGYIILDPNTGAGAYMISGGASGDFIVKALVSIISYFTVTDAEAAELDDTYISQAPGPVIQNPPPPDPGCIQYFHADEANGCLSLAALASNTFWQGLGTITGAAMGGLVVSLFTGSLVGIIVCAICIAVALYLAYIVIKQCRQMAIHC